MSFKIFIDRLLDSEGDYSDDPNDPGNWTGGKVNVGFLGGSKYGISCATYPHLSIKDLTLDAAKEIYYQDFWMPAACESMPDAVAFQLLDGAVNSGIPQAARWLQAAAGVTVDGNIGPLTRAAVVAADHNDIVLRFLGARLDFMTRLHNWPSAGAGWARRIARNLGYAAQDN